MRANPPQFFARTLFAGLSLLAFAACGGGEGGSGSGGEGKGQGPEESTAASQGSSLKGANHPSATSASSIAASGDIQIQYEQAAANISKPRDLWYLSLIAYSNQRDMLTSTFTLAPDFDPAPGTYPAASRVFGEDLPDISLTFAYQPEPGDIDSMRNYSEKGSGEVTFTSVDPKLEGTYAYTVEDEDGNSVSVSGRFSVDRPTDFPDGT